MSEPPFAANAAGYDAVAAAATTVPPASSVASAGVGTAGGAKSIVPTTREALDRHATFTGTPTRAAPVAGATHVGTTAPLWRFWAVSVSAVSVAFMADILAEFHDTVPSLRRAGQMASPSGLSSDHATVMTPPPTADVDVGATPLGDAGMRKISTSTDVYALDVGLADWHSVPPTSTRAGQIRDRPPSRTAGISSPRRRP